jgi:hypothetical protein
MTDEATNSEEIPSEDETSLPESAEQSETQENVEATEAEAEQEEKPRKPTAKDRIDELTRLRREAERDAEYWKAKALQPTPTEVQPPVQQQVQEQAPNPEAYDAGEFDARYIKDLARFEARQEFAQQQAEREAREQQSRIATSFDEKVAKAVEAHDDFFDVVGSQFERAAAVCSPAMREAVLNSELGPQVAYHLAQNPTEAARIARLSPPQAFLEIGRLEAKLTETPKAKTATDAPAPTPQVRGSGGKFAVQPDTNDFAAFEKQYGGSD